MIVEGLIEPLCPVCGDLMEERGDASLICGPAYLVCWNAECAFEEIGMTYLQRLRIIDLLDGLKKK